MGLFAIQLVIETFIDCSTVSARMGNLVTLAGMARVGHEPAATGAGARSSIVQLAPDLFSIAGMPLQFARREAAREGSCSVSFSYRDGASGWDVHCRVDRCIEEDVPSHDPSQHFFKFSYATTEVAPLVSPVQSAFLNRRLRPMFIETHALRDAMLWLKQQGVLYVGDIVRMTREELIACLGSRHERVVRRIEERLHEIGIGLAAPVPWWRRPAQYYRCYA